VSDVRCLIIDLDGVIRHWDAAQFAATVASFGVEMEDFAAIAFERELLTAAMTGALTAEDWAEEIGRRTATLHDADAAAVAAGFAALGWTIDHEAVALIREVRAAGRANVALFSNASTRLEADLESCQLDGEFDVIFSSARLGLAKPDVDAFRTVARLLDVPAAACLFVDDIRSNVEGARAAGMQAEIFTTVAALRSVLERAGLVDHAAATP
jgi:putative hydrolase of the HAD superfamily